MPAAVNIFDRVLKVLAREHPGRLLELALPGISLRIVGTLENVELALPEERVDFLHRVIYNGQEYLLHIEFQWKHRADVPRRLFIYSAMLTRQLGRPVLTVVFYLAPRRAPIPTSYEVQVGGVVVNRFEYPVVKLWEYADEIAQGRWPELAPLLVALVEGPPDVSVLAREKELILQERNESKQANLLACAITIAARYFNKDFLWRFFREEVETMRNATFIEEWLQEKLEEGLQKGLQQGLQQGSQRTRWEDLQRVLRWRFGRVPKELREHWREFTVEQMALLFDEALQAPDLKTFREALARLRGERSS